MELELEQTQQGSSHEVSVSTEGVEELKRIRSIRFYWLSHSEIVDIEKVVVHSSLQVPNIKGTVKFGNDQIAPILGYGDLVQGDVTIKRVYYVEGLNHNLFSVGSCGTDLYSITLQETNSLNPICLMAKATSSQAWLWRHRLSHMTFDTINLLSKNDIVVGLPKLKFVKDHLCSS
nr:hypothetical protein [Tanacetum cinerariifolium]